MRTRRGDEAAGLVHLKRRKKNKKEEKRRKKNEGRKGLSIRALSERLARVVAVGTQIFLLFFVLLYFTP